jgi:hypothetical protein
MLKVNCKSEPGDQHGMDILNSRRPVLSGVAWLSVKFLKI